MKFIKLVIILLFSSLTAFTQQIDIDNSNVEFLVRNMRIRTVKGSFTNMTGTISFNENKLNEASFNVCINASTINTENKKRDKHLKKKDFFDVATYPTICFLSTYVSKENDQYIVTGKLTMKGITKEISIPLNFINNSFKGTLKLNRTDYNIGSKGGFMVGKEIKITINIKLK